MQSPHMPESAIPLEEIMESISLQSEYPGEKFNEDDAGIWGNMSAGPCGAPSIVETTEEVVENLWAHYGEEQPVVPNGDPVIICELHGVICKPSICNQYWNQKKEFEKQIEEARKQAAEAAHAKRKKSKNDGGFPSLFLRC